MDIFVARQPIFNRSHSVVGYELLYRDSDLNLFNPQVASDIATSLLLINSYFHFGIEHLVGTSTAFINFDQKMIDSDAPKLLPTKNVVIEVLESVEPTPETLAKLTALRLEGYTLAIDDFTLDYPHKALIQVAQILKVDFKANNREAISTIARVYQRQGKVLLAEKVETMEDYDWAKRLGFDYFQGYFFAKPVMLKGKNVNTSAAQYMRLMDAIKAPEPNFKTITQIIEVDVVLTYKLLRIVNSSFSLGSKINSIHHALSILGIHQFSKWLTLTALNQVTTEENQALVKIAMIRSKLLETIGNRSHYLEGYQDELALMGIVSVLDTLLNEPFDALVHKLPLSQNIIDTFLGIENPFYYPYHLCLVYEKGHFSRIQAYSDMIDYPIEALSDDYVNAVKWAEDLYHYLHESEDLPK